MVLNKDRGMGVCARTKLWDSSVTGLNKIAFPGCKKQMQQKVDVTGPHFYCPYFSGAS